MAIERVVAVAEMCANQNIFELALADTIGVASPKDVRERFEAQAFELPLGTPEAFPAHIATESKRWGEVIKRAGISAK